MKYTVRIMTCLMACMGTSCLLLGQTSDWVRLASDEVGLTDRSAFGLYVADINNDQYPDLITVEGVSGPAVENTLRVYLNVQDASASNMRGRRFLDVTESSGVNRKPGTTESSRGTSVVVLGDVNNDGNIDLIRGNYYHRLEDYVDYGDRCEVLLGDGQGHFHLVDNNGLHDLGLINPTGFSLLDYDKDGNLDLFIAPWFKDYAQNVWNHGYLLRGNGDGTFTDVSNQAGITKLEPMYGSSVVDWNNDGWPDIATAPYCRTDGQLLRNNGDGTFTDVASTVGYNARYMGGDGGQPMCMWGSVPEDYDNDGDMDFFFNLVHGGSGTNEGRSAIVVNKGGANGYQLEPDRSLTERKWLQSAHLGDYDASWLDMDNDGLMDLVMTQGSYDPPKDRLYVFRQGGNKVLTDVSLELGLTGSAQRNVHRVEAIDFDLDGDDDILYCLNGTPRTMHLLENRVGHSNNWAGVRLHAPAGVNGSCIGARVYVWSGGVQRMREVYAGRGNGSGQQPFALLFGLGSNAKIDSIKVLWPDSKGSETQVLNPPVNQYLDITLKGLAVKKFESGRKAHDNRIIIYPNPAKDYLLINWMNNEEDFRIELFDVIGRLIGESEYRHATGTVYYSIATLPRGQYIIRGVTERGRIFTSQFSKE